LYVVNNHSSWKTNRGKERDEKLKIIIFSNQDKTTTKNGNEE